MIFRGAAGRNLVNGYAENGHNSGRSRSEKHADISAFLTFTGAKKLIRCRWVLRRQMVTGSFRIIAKLKLWPGNVSILRRSEHKHPFDSFTGSITGAVRVSPVVTGLTLNIDNGLEPQFVVRTLLPSGQTSETSMSGLYAIAL